MYSIAVRYSERTKTIQRVSYSSSIRLFETRQITNLDNNLLFLIFIKHHKFTIIVEH